MAVSDETTGGLKQIPTLTGAQPASSAPAMLENLRQRFDAMPVRRRNSLIAMVVFLVGSIALMGWYAQRPDWRTLFSGLETKDVQQVTQELAAAGITYQTSSDGSTVEVPADALDKARMEVASKGMPQSGRLGFELFDKPNWVGSEFDERVNYQRALEGELEHTIATIAAVRSARVHLVLPQQSLFTSEQRLAKASVVLKLKRSALDPDQADAIRSLIASSVENLSPEQVTLVDADGRANLKPRLKDSQVSDVEQALEAKLVAMLEPLAGHDNVRATVNLSYEEGAEERMDEVYDPTNVVALSMQKSDQTASQVVRAQGIPGTASNSPSAAAVGAAAGSQAAASPGAPPLLQKEVLPVYPQNAPPGQTLHQENGTYAVTKHTVRQEEGPGRLRRVSAAVVINDRSVTDTAGKSSWKSRSPDEMRRLEQLAQAALGFDGKRGDQIVLENVSFTSNLPETRAPALQRLLDESRAFLEQQPGLARNLMTGLCGVLLVLFVLRPVARQVTETLHQPLLLPAPLASVDVAPLPVMTASAPIREIEPERNRPPHLPGIFEHVSEHIRREPVQSTRLLEAWIASEDRGTKA